MAKTKKTQHRKKTQVISFRVTEEIYSKLENYAANQTDEMGSPLNVTSAARRLMLMALQTSNQKRQ